MTFFIIATAGLFDRLHVRLHPHPGVQVRARLDDEGLRELDAGVLAQGGLARRRQADVQIQGIQERRGEVHAHTLANSRSQSLFRHYFRSKIKLMCVKQ